jgi:hypothetical protein
MGLAQRVYADDLTRELFGLAAELADKELREPPPRRSAMASSP